MSMKRDLTPAKGPSMKQSILESLKPFSNLIQDPVSSSINKLPLIKSSVNHLPKRTLLNSLAKSTQASSSEDLKKEKPTLPKPQQLTPRSTKSSRNPTNIVTRVAFKSRVGSILGKPKVHNQDSFIIKPSLQGLRGQYMFAVCDGHGTYGHHVSQYVRDSFPSFLEECLDHDLSSLMIEKSFHQAITKLSKGLLETGIEIAFSGTTLNCVTIFGSLCVCANVGDSRSVLGKLNQGIWDYVELSQDHNTKRYDERMRILGSNGRIAQAKDEEGNYDGPERVWLMDDDIPGLAMTRSVGDKISKIVGVTSDPEVLIKRLNCEDKFIIIASDGVWEHIDSKEAVMVVSGYYQEGKYEEAAGALAMEAAKRWDKDDYVDDITVVIIFLLA